AFGGFGGKLSHLTANELGGAASLAAVKELPEGTPIDSVIYGNVLQTSSDAPYLARHVGHRAGLKIEAPALTINRLCGSGFQALINGAQDIMTGEANIVLTGGSESMSQAPYALRGTRMGTKYGVDQKLEDTLAHALVDQYPTKTPMGITAENLGKQFNISRQDADHYALRSQQRWAQAHANGIFAKEIAPVEVKTRKGVDLFSVDEHPRPHTTIESLAKLSSVFVKDVGVVTAGNASGICDGAASLIVASEAAVKQFNLTPLAEILSWYYVGVEPTIMGIGPVPAVRGALKRANLSLKDMARVEVNEAFAVQYLAVEKDLGLDPEITNSNGGAIALGHPLGASGARIMAHLTHELHRINGRYAVGAACIGGGQGIAVVIENYDHLVLDVGGVSSEDLAAAPHGVLDGDCGPGGGGGGVMGAAPPSASSVAVAVVAAAVVAAAGAAMAGSAYRAAAGVTADRRLRSSIGSNNNNNHPPAAGASQATVPSGTAVPTVHDTVGMAEWNLANKRVGDDGVRLAVEALRADFSPSALHAHLASSRSAHQQLVRLSLKCNNLTDATAHSIADALRTNTGLRELGLEFNRLTYAGARSLARALEVNQHLEVLDLSGNPIEDAGATALARAVQFNSTLRSLRMLGCAVTDTGASAIATAIANPATVSKLRELVLSRNHIGHRTATAFANALARQSNIAGATACALERLDLSSCGIENSIACALAPGLRLAGRLRYLDLHENHISDSGAAALAAALTDEPPPSTIQPGAPLPASLNTPSSNGSPPLSKQTSALTLSSLLVRAVSSLSFGTTSIPRSDPPILPQGVAVAEQPLPLPPPRCGVEVLDLNRNRIHESGAVALARGVARRGSRLRELRLYGNSLGPRGTAALAAAVSTTGGGAPLEVLDLDFNAVGPDGAVALAKALASPDCPIAALGLCSNGIDADAARAIATALTPSATGGNRHLRTLRISGNPLLDDGAVALAAAAAVHPRLERLELSVCGVGDRAAAALARAAKHNPRIAALSLSSNAISDVGAIALADALIPDEFPCPAATVSSVRPAPSKVPATMSGEPTDASQDPSTNPDLLAVNSSVAAAAGHRRWWPIGLHDLRLSRNFIGDAGAQALARALPSSSLAVLVLGLNPPVGPEGTDALRRAAHLSPDLVSAMFSARHDGRDLPADVADRNARLARLRDDACRALLRSARPLLIEPHRPLAAAAAAADADTDADATDASGGVVATGWYRLPPELRRHVLAQGWPASPQDDTRARRQLATALAALADRRSLGRLDDRLERFSARCFLARCRDFLLDVGAA
ncbi:hypothetical protein HK405_005603, partial [Cladochytrium tenue]